MFCVENVFKIIIKYIIENIETKNKIYKFKDFISDIFKRKKMLMTYIGSNNKKWLKYKLMKIVKYLKGKFIMLLENFSIIKVVNIKR